MPTSKGPIARLKAFKLSESKAEFLMRQQAIGFTLQEHSLLCDESLDDIIESASQYCHDWVHGMFRPTRCLRLACPPPPNGVPP